jgi:hypothetical protein
MKNRHSALSRWNAGFIALLAIQSLFAFLGCCPEGEYDKGNENVPWNANRASNNKSERHYDNDTKNNVQTASAECFHCQSPPKLGFCIAKPSSQAATTRKYIRL